MKFTIGEAERRKRRRNVAWGLVLSLALVGIIAYEHARSPGQYNEVLLWSVVGFVVLANLISYYRHRRYLAKTRGHSLELAPGRLVFRTGSERSELDLEEIAALRLFRAGEQLRHIQILLKNHRGIRLEGYQDLDELARLLAEQIPPEKIMGS